MKFVAPEIITVLDKVDRIKVIRDELRELKERFQEFPQSAGSGLSEQVVLERRVENAVRELLPDRGILLYAIRRTWAEAQNDLTRRRKVADLAVLYASLGLQGDKDYFDQAAKEIQMGVAEELASLRNMVFVAQEVIKKTRMVDPDGMNDIYLEETQEMRRLMKEIDQARSSLPIE